MNPVILTHQKDHVLLHNLSNLLMTTTRIYQSSNSNISNLIINFKESRIVDNITKKEIQWYLMEPDIGGEDPDIVIFVQSRPLARSARDLIRNTWANGSYYNDDVTGKPFVFFVCGLDPSCNCVCDTLMTEILMKKDILLVNIQDTYDNLTLKGLLTMHWILKRFGGSLKYVIKTDDDVMLNTFRWLSILRSSSFNNTSSFILGYVWQRSKVKREGKYRVSKEQYPEEYYPSFCAGPGYAMSRDAMTVLLKMTSKVRYLNREDVFITGLLAAAGRISRYSFSKDSYKLYSFQMKNNIRWESSILVHGTNIITRRNVWQKYVKSCRRRKKVYLGKSLSYLLTDVTRE
ncbi:hypothetical protein LSH36_1524g00034 [Paralvinella palmiformis]|uniref:Hexosyltransferase n=1 Tax=Paralvinella palmiformis TaxID=53620 RepID=A0AAD9IS67_9ANNE|nr:hypothetical protein LSH36_1524g00034 [Paralvinella palmiformis]